MPFKTNIKWDDPEVQSQIRSMALSGMTQTEIGNYFGVTKQRIRQIYLKFNLFSSDEIYGKRASASRKEKKHRDTYKRKWGVDFGELTKNDLFKVRNEKLRAKKNNAAKAGVEWSLTYGDIEWPTHCPILGLELDYNAEFRQENSVSFDRIDPSRGYVKGNVIILSWRANRIKNDGSAEEHRKIANFLDNLSKVE